MSQKGTPGTWFISLSQEFYNEYSSIQLNTY
jgi:hypothetical protein